MGRKPPWAFSYNNNIFQRVDGTIPRDSKQEKRKHTRLRVTSERWANHLGCKWSPPTPVRWPKAADARRTTSGVIRGRAGTSEGKMGAETVPLEFQRVLHFWASLFTMAFG